MIHYELDFYGWTQEQAALLKTGRLGELDVMNLIEEIESMGRSERRELQSRLTVLLVRATSLKACLCACRSPLWREPDDTPS